MFTASGGCLCDEVRYETSKTPIDAGFCHCRICQKSSGAPTLLWLTLPREGFRYTRGVARSYASSETGIREFCGKCGTQLIFYTSQSPDTIDVTVASLDEPGLIKPDYHIWTVSQIAWVEFADHLPKYADAGPDG